MKPMGDDSEMEALRGVIRQHWGFRELRPLQEHAMRSVLARRDSLVVLPTGGGKSLCFQGPAVYRKRETTIVVSPLIALMKDQVDNLRAVGIAAGTLDSSQTADERATVERQLFSGELRLLFVSPERLAMSGFQGMLQRLGVKTFAIDEAHCISHWGHDFRPEYRELIRLRERFPDASFHAYTATATERVREDIVAQLGLQNPDILVGRFERLNLTFRVLTRNQVNKQVLEVIDRHKGEAGIIYCIRRKDVDELTVQLRGRGINARPYHAGLTPLERAATQNAFRSESCDIVVATVAFGMGIDRSNVRFVLHTGMPKSIEHYQQEAGRAGRDGLEAECVLLYSGGDLLTWKSVIEKSAEEAEVDPEFVPSAIQHLNEMGGYCRAAHCRHRVLTEHFGQPFELPNCNACDFCLGEVEVETDSQDIARKILSGVARTQQRFGIGHVVDVLHGKTSDRIRQYGHDQLTTFGLLKAYRAEDIRDWTYQLLMLDVLEQSDGEYPTLRLNQASWRVMRNEQQVCLTRPTRKKKTKQTESESISWAGVDRDLFDALRNLRRQLASEKGVPPYVVFPDNTLRELARYQPKSLSGMQAIYGIGEAKLRDYGQIFLDAIQEYLAQHPQPTPIAKRGA
ncbi:DNA helicase RecQ [Tuwongella immobilis]|uniref:DNA helicase RecQ n=1 Tax=Tuwongella immobilis TaxID=692036 RepID=A0A6C2YM46_9BACT|nr:DNA helicase RecQ [Tuwongella immobilis]VIP02299.1 atp-dependent dna helicase : ATP-dependent DNA helicase RecQ OS=Rhodopirellula maiorica SM1 GN=RMSM_02027 PE=4 SV=1: DEAD: Helicase_C: RQC: HRDC [Tuwongella immobilis]VTS00983.1 atp-dependent dna helicase : ATP-dependent DNA helicase RecQ OS=Rhodopirellula maiorica SM1 GN=RMSM_02027 PE=4 SV=1: DEAD: Helicase_C: RQC: HRDC [Tuwongella immobilis]